jgi:hypothetical protein
MQEERKPFRHENRVIYEWDESLDTVYCYIELPPLPPNIKPAAILKVSIASTSISVGFKDTPPYLSHQLQGIADTQESCWYISEKKGQTGKDMGLKELVIELQKAQKGVRWGCLFQGHGTMNPLEEETLKKKLLLERFQEENPGFDFSGAEFNGQVPEARTFMGGPKTT